MLRPVTICCFLGSVVSIFCLATQSTVAHSGSLPRQDPQTIYSADPHDSWNRIFYFLFTRTVETRLTDDFKSHDFKSNDFKSNDLKSDDFKSDEFKPEGPFVPAHAMGNPAVLVTSRTVERIEIGDRAIDPLYPNFLSTKGSEPILTDPGFAEFKRALQEACADTTPRTPLQRALMQSDVWAARDIVNMSMETPGPAGDRAGILLPLLDRFIGKLALNADEIAALPRNYQAAQSPLNLPRVFDENSGWIEVEWSPVRSHDQMGGNRHAARIFLKPHANPRSFLKEINKRVQKHNDPLPGGIRNLDAAVLITEVLLVDTDGRVVPTPLTSDVQLRTVTRDVEGNFKGSTVDEFELSRRGMLLGSASASGGFIHRDGNDPAYLPASGNDFTFATPQMTGTEPAPPILGTLRRRCESCHFETAVFTFQMIPIPGRPTLPVRQLRAADDERAAYVAGKKMQSREFRSLHLGLVRIDGR